MESSIYAVWAPFNDGESYLDINGGIFIADSYAGDLVGTSTDPGSFDGTMANENSNRALIYAGFGGNINVYGGYFLYNNTPNDIKNRNNGAFNAKDFYNGATPLITIHEGVMLIDKAYRQDPTYTSTPNGDFDNFSIKLDGEDEKLAEIAQVTLDTPITIDGKQYGTWYQVQRKFYNLTFMDNDGNKLDTIKIPFGTAVNVDAKDDVARGKLTGVDATDFEYWVNAASAKITDIGANNTNHVVLYPKLKEMCTVRWLNEDGTVIHSVTTTSGTRYDKLTAPTNPTSKYGNMTFNHWEVREKDSNGKVTYIDLNENKNYNITKDITIYPFYSYNGNIGLIPHDDDEDGRADYYTVEAVDGLSGVVTIPGYVNGAQVRVITDLCGGTFMGINTGITDVVIEEGVKEISSNSLALTTKLKTVQIPASVTKVGSNAFANTVGGSIIRKKVAITYAGTWRNWIDNVCESGWDSGLQSGSTVVCLENGILVTYQKTGNAWENGESKWQKQ
jgi:hypothetical protein